MISQFLPNGYRRTGDPALDERLMTLPPARSSTDFAPKLSERQRKSAYAFHLQGFPRTAIAILFGINKRTVGHMVRPSSPHYRSIRKEAESMGHSAFIREYVTDDDFKQMAEVLASDQYKKAKASDQDFTNEKNKAAGVPNKSAVRHAGIHKVVRALTGQTHTVEIQWNDEFGCWAFRCVDPPENDLLADGSWTVAEPEENTFTSSLTHKYVVASSAW